MKLVQVTLVIVTEVLNLIVIDSIEAFSVEVLEPLLESLRSNEQLLPETFAFVIL